MKLFILDCGRVQVPDMSYLTPGQNVGKPITIPYCMFVIDHPKGLVLFDTGPMVEHWPEEKAAETRTTADQRVDLQLLTLGYNPEDVKYVVLSHMHMDHCGGMTLFPHATFIIRKEELRSAWWPETHEGGYIYNDYKDTRGFRYVQPGDDEEVDIFLDGSLVCIDTKGHTRGHQSLIVTLPYSGKMVLAADAVLVNANLRDNVPPGLCWNSELAIGVIERLRHMEEQGMKIITGHDPELWLGLKIAPDSYE
jgi:N-acyl homoserine lactone hydrolase